MIDSSKVKVTPNRSQQDLDSQIITLYAPKQLSDLPHSVVLLNNNFCVVDKPSAVRMDGDFNVTVTKLVEYWQPSLVESSLKCVHQLDYATSGALCIALNTPAAAMASKAFELRETKKQYLAVVQGHLDLNLYPVLHNIENPFIQREVMSGIVIPGSGLTVPQDNVFGNSIILSNFMQYYNILQELAQCATAEEAEQSDSPTNAAHNVSSHVAGVFINNSRRSDYLKIRAESGVNKSFERLRRAELAVFATDAVARQALKKLVKWLKIKVELEHFKRGAGVSVAAVQSQMKRVRKGEMPSSSCAEGVDRYSLIGDDEAAVGADQGNLQSDDSHILRLLQRAMLPEFRYNDEYSRRDEEGVSVPNSDGEVFPHIYRLSSAGGEQGRLLFVNIPLAGKPEDFRYVCCCC